MAKVTPLLWTHKSNAAGHHPIYLRVADAQRTLYVSLSVYLHKRHWNDRTRTVRKGHPNADVINALIQQRLSEAEAERVRLMTRREPATAETIKKVLTLKSVSSGDFFSFADAHVRDLQKRGQIREHRREKSVLVKFRAFTGEPLPFENITPRLLRDYETHLIESYKNQTSTVHSNFRVIRTILYRAIREGHLEQERNPFSRFKLKKGKKTERPKLSLIQVQALAALDLGGHGPSAPLIARVRDYFLFSLYVAGIRFGDVAELKRADLAEEDGGLRLTYTMSKTQKRHTLRLIPQAEAIVRSYLPPEEERANAQEGYLFPILDGYDVSTPDKRINAISSQNALVNKYLKQLARQVQDGGTAMPEKLSFHIARHTFADLLRRSGGDVYAISKALGHSGLNITEHYLAGFDSEALDGSLAGVFGR